VLGPREDEVGLNAVSYEGSHGNTSVLNLGLTKPSDGEFVGLSPKSSISETKGVKVTDDRVEFGAKSLKVSLLE
jgi:hypothetical protein